MFVVALDLSRAEESLPSLHRWLAKVAHYTKRYHSTVSTESSKLQKYTNTAFLKTARSNKGAVSRPVTPEEVDGQAAAPDDTFEFIVERFSLPVVVVGTKADLVVANDGLSMKRAREVQGQLRALCLEIGAALVYTSTTTETNCAALRKYVEHRLYPESITSDAGIEVSWPK